MTARIYVPNETTACSLGADEVAAVVEQQLRHHRIEAELIRNGSRGAFHLEPLIEVEQEVGGEWQRIGFGPMAPGDVSSLFDGASLPGLDHPLSLGPIDAIPFLADQTRLTFARVGESVPLDFAAYQKLGGLRALERALAMEPDEILREIEDSGLRGRGGAAFPAYIKWRSVLGAPGDEKYIVCNADEGDSGTFADRLLMESDPFQLLEAMVIAGITVGAASGYIYLRSEYPKAHEFLREAIEIAHTNGLLGDNIFDSGKSFEVILRLGAGSYICGEETAMLESIEGKRGIVRKKPPLPALSGLFGKPTLVHNVLTLAAVTSILADGSQQYAAHGDGRSRGTMPFQLAGNIARGGLIEVPFGVPLETLLTRFGGGSYSGRPLKAVQVGGPLGAYLPAEKWHLALEYETFTAAGAMLGHGGVVAFDDTVDLDEQAEFAMRFCALESCGKCTPCRIGSKRGEELIQRIRRGENREPNLELLEDLMETLELGSLCALGGLTPMPIRSILQGFPDALAGAAGDIGGSSGKTSGKISDG
jgi:formate dehydrogenase iron-sulfur subunit